jgi:hypothetical protein
MPTTYQLIASNTVGVGGATSLTFSSIPSTFTDLCMKVSARTNEADTYSGVLLYLNNDRTGVYDFIRNVGNGSTITSASASANNQMYINFAANGNTSTASTFSNSEFYLPNYRSSTFKSVSADTAQENNASLAYSTVQAHLWKNTSAVTSIVVEPSGGSFLQNSTFYLYGISKS